MPSERKTANRRKVKRIWPEIRKRFLSEFSAIGRSKPTVRLYERAVDDFARFVRHQDIRLVTGKTIAEYAEYVAKNFKLASHGKFEWLLRVKIFFRWAERSGYILADPAGRLQLPAIKERSYPAYISAPEMAALLDGIPTGTAEGLADRAMLELLYSSGLRSGELCRLTQSAIDFDEGTVTVLLGKGKKDRVVPVGTVALHWLSRHVEQARKLDPEAPLFRHRSGLPLRDWFLCRAIRRYAAAAGIAKDCRPRTFRHCFAIHLLEGGASIRHIAAMMGHSNLQTTQTYTHILPRELKRAHKASHPAERDRRRRFFPLAAPSLFYKAADCCKLDGNGSRKRQKEAEKTPLKTWQNSR
jgi:integrase/recombinase XerD